MTDHATVILYDHITSSYTKHQYKKLKKAVRRLEKVALNDCPYYMDISVRQYKQILGLDKFLKRYTSDISMAVPGKWFTLKQIGWFKGLPLMNIDIDTNKWDPD